MQLVTISKRIESLAAQSDQNDKDCENLYFNTLASDERYRNASGQRRVAQRDLIAEIQPATTKLGVLTEQYSSDSAELEQEIRESRRAMDAASARADQQATAHKAFVETCSDEIAKAEASEKPDVDYINSRYRAIAKSQEACLEQEERLSESIDQVNGLLDQQEELKQAMIAQTKPLLSRVTSLSRQLRNLHDEERWMVTEQQAMRKVQILKLDGHRSTRSVLAKRRRGLIVKRSSVLKGLRIE